MYEALKYSLLADIAVIHSQMIRDAARRLWRERNGGPRPASPPEVTAQIIARTVLGAEAGQRIF